MDLKTLSDLGECSYENELKTYCFKVVSIGDRGHCLRGWPGSVRPLVCRRAHALADRGGGRTRGYVVRGPHEPIKSISLVYILVGDWARLPTLARYIAVDERIRLGLWRALVTAIQLSESVCQVQVIHFLSNALCFAANIKIYFY